MNTTFTFELKTKKRTKDNLINIKVQCRATHSFIYSFSWPGFHWGESQRQQPQEDPKYLTINSNLRQFCWLHTKTGPSRLGDVVTPPGPWTNFGPLSVGVDWNLKDLVRHSFLGAFWTHGRTNIAGISRFGEVAWHPGLCGFQTCALCHEVLHRELFANIPISAVCSFDNFFSVVT